MSTNERCSRGSRGVRLMFLMKWIITIHQPINDKKKFLGCDYIFRYLLVMFVALSHAGATGSLAVAACGDVISRSSPYSDVLNFLMLPLIPT